MIIAAGYRVGPFEVESVCLEHPAVREAAAVASPDELRGNIVKAFIVLAADNEPSEGAGRRNRTVVGERLSAYAYPRRIEFVADLTRRSRERSGASSSASWSSNEPAPCAAEPTSAGGVVSWHDQRLSVAPVFLLMRPC